MSFNPLNIKHRTESNLIMVEFICKWGSTIATSIAVFVAGYFFMSGLIGDYQLFGWNAGNLIAALGGIAAAIIAGWATDFAFGDFLQESVYQFLDFWNFKWVRIPANHSFFSHYGLGTLYFVFMSTLVGGLLYFDIYCIKLSNDPVANMAKQEIEIDVIGTTERMNAANNAALTPLNDNVKSLEKKIKDEEMKVERNNAALMKLVRENNGWAASQINAQKKQSTRKLKQDLEKAQSNYTEATGAAAKALSGNMAGLQQKNATITQSNAASRAAVSGIFNWFGIGMKMITVIVRIMLVVIFMRKFPKFDANGDGVVDHKDVNMAFSNRVENFR